MLEDVAQPSAVAQALEKSPPLANRATMLDHRRQPAHQPIIEAGQRVRWVILKPAQIDPCFQHGEICPKVRTTKSEDFTKFHSNLISHSNEMGILPNAENDENLRWTRQCCEYLDRYYRQVL